MGPVEDERRGAIRIGNAVNKETKLRARPAAITLTAGAEARIAELMQRAPEGAIGVKLSTPRRGCSGLAYSVDYVDRGAALRREDRDTRRRLLRRRRFGPLPDRLDRWTGARTISPPASCSTIPMRRAPAAAAKASPSDRKMLIASAQEVSHASPCVFGSTGHDDDGDRSELGTDPAAQIRGRVPNGQCPHTTSYLADRSGLYRGQPLTPRKLTELPPATGYMAVFRHIGDCEAPLTMVEYRSPHRAERSGSSICLRSGFY